MDDAREGDPAGGDETSLAPGILPYRAFIFSVSVGVLISTSFSNDDRKGGVVALAAVAEIEFSDWFEGMLGAEVEAVAEVAAEAVMEAEVETAAEAEVEAAVEAEVEAAVEAP